MGKELEKMMFEIFVPEKTVWFLWFEINHITDAPKVGIAPYYGIKTYIRER